MEHIPTEYYTKPAEVPDNFRPARLRNGLFLLRDIYNERIILKPIIEKAVEFSRKQGIDRIYCALQGPLMFRLATAIAEKLGVPLLSHVYDPPDWWLTVNNAPRIVQKRVQQAYENTLRASEAVSAASWEMAEVYSRDYQTRAIPVIPSLDKNLALPPVQTMNSGREFVIGMAGQLYASTEWSALLAALDKADWHVAGKDIKLRLLASRAVLQTESKARIEYLGWHSQPETIRLLSEVDANYCPYRFGKAFETEARLCFPSKLTTYLAAGRPVLFHGPDYSSPARLLKRYNAGVYAHSLQPDEIIHAIQNLIEDTSLYTKLAPNGRRAFDENLTLDVYRQRFAEALGVQSDYLMPV